jgi:hypothetical protein
MSRFLVRGSGNLFIPRNLPRTSCVDWSQKNAGPERGYTNQPFNAPVYAPFGQRTDY